VSETKDNSSLPLLLAITGAVVVVAVGGWFFLDQEPAPSSSTQAPQPVVSTIEEVADTPVTADNVRLDDDQVMPVDELPVESEDEGAAAPDTAATTVDAELSKARLAAGADMLVLPVDQSALHYYQRVLDADPQHAIAIAERDAVLTRVSQTVAEHLDAEEFDAAYDIAALVAQHDPQHPLVVNAQQTLDERTEQLVQKAIESARAARHSEAGDFLSAAEALPGRNPLYLAEARASITEIRDGQEAAERNRVRRAQTAREDARDAWVQSTRSAIASGDLISPAGASARDLLAADNAWDNDREQLTGELIAAMLQSTQQSIDAESPLQAERLVNALSDMSVDSDTLESLHTQIEATYIAVESRRVAAMSELVQIKRVAPKYPRAAERRSLAGWVNVLFTVTPDGNTTDIVIHDADPADIFNDSAIAAVGKWVFEPIEYRGQLINKRAAARLVFRVE